MSSEALDLLEKMLIFDPNKRITGMLEELCFKDSFLTCFFNVISHFLSIDLVFSFICTSWWSTMSSISFITSWHQWWTGWSWAIQFWFWAANMHWRAHQGAHLEGIGEVQSRSTQSVILSWMMIPLLLLGVDIQREISDWYD